MPIAFIPINQNFLLRNERNDRNERNKRNERNIIRRRGAGFRFRGCKDDSRGLFLIYVFLNIVFRRKNRYS